MLTRTIYKESKSLICARCKTEVISGNNININLKKKGFEALNAFWHPECFCCAKCGKQLPGNQFKESDDKKLAYCKDCYQSDHITLCATCNKPITRYDYL